MFEKFKKNANQISPNQLRFMLVIMEVFGLTWMNFLPAQK